MNSGGDDSTKTAALVARYLAAETPLETAAPLSSITLEPVRTP
jgi:hypothetical protein